MDEFIDKMISYSVKDFQYYKIDSYTWLLSQEKREWVIGIAQNGYTWYNYSFFKNLFNYLSLDVGDDNIHIRNWIEKNLNIRVNEHCHPDYLPGEYDWSDDFSFDEIISNIK